VRSEFSIEKIKQQCTFVNIPELIFGAVVVDEEQMIPSDKARHARRESAQELRFTTQSRLPLWILNFQL